MFDFDKVNQRRGTGCVKWDNDRDGVIPMWVADMDFRVPDPVIKALRDRTEHGIFGYGAAEENYYDAVCGWFRTHFHFDVDPRWIVTTPGVVFALSAAIRTFTEKGDAVLINRPVYYPFSNLIDGLKRRLINSPLQLKDGRYEIDFADVEEKIVSSGVRLYLLCSPHNPVGRVWTREELKKLGDICLKHDVLIVADEIHCDFVWSDHPHTVFASLGEPYRRRCILCTAPSKTFNLAGLVGSYHIVFNRMLRDRLEAKSRKSHYNTMNVLSMHALIGAYEAEGYTWVNELCQVLSENVEYAVNHIRDYYRGINVSKPQGTYMLFLDCEDWCEENYKSLDELLKAGWDVGVAWQDGRPFHQEYGIRMNLALPLSRVKEAFERLDEYVFHV